MDTNEEIRLEIEAEDRRREEEKVMPPAVNKIPVQLSKFVWMIGAVVIDVATAYYIWQTTNLFYGILWAFIGAGGLLYSEQLRERIGNNEPQKGIGNLGVYISGGAVLVMAVFMGAAYLTQITSANWVMISVEVSTVLLAAYHFIQSYRYHLLDDEYQEQNEDARAEAENQRDIRQVHRAARKVESLKARRDIATEYRNEHGAALDAAYQVITKKPFISLNSETRMAELGPTQAGSKQE